jgi:Leucine-rich repeat (LRR) protein
MSSYPVCAWHGVRCVEEENSFGRVESLNLSSNGLAGYVPREIALLESDIRILDLGNNAIEGTVPEAIAGLTNLGKRYLFSSCLLYILFPSHTRTHTHTHKSTTEQLFLGTNFFNATIPPGLFSLARLTHLFINDCDLSGTIPEALGEKLTNLQALGLHNNQLESSLPPSIGLLRELYVLYS